MTIKQTIILVILLCNFNLFSQNSDLILDTYDSLTNTKSLNHIDKKHILDSLSFSDSTIKDQDRLGNIYYNLSKKFYYDNIDVCLNYALKVDSIGKKLNKIEEGFYRKNSRNLTKIYYKKGLYKETIISGEEYLKRFPNDIKKNSIIYRNIGNAYSDSGDLNKAISYYEKAIYTAKLDNSLNEETKTLINLIEVIDKLKDVSYKSRFYSILKRIETINKDGALSERQQIKIGVNAGAYFVFLGDYINAKKYLEISEKSSDSLTIFKSLINIGIANRKTGDYKASRLVFKRAFNFTNNSVEKQASLFNNLADLYKEELNYKEALNNYNKAITYVLGYTKKTNITIPDAENIPLTTNKIDLLNYIIDKANFLTLMDDISSIDLEYTLKLCNSADNILDAIYFESREDFSKLFWREQASKLYLNAVDIAYRLNKPEKAFYYIEKSKALLLLESITNSKAKELANLPKHLIDREYNLLQNIKNNNNVLLYLKKNNKKTAVIDSIKNETFKYKQKYTKFIDSLELKFPTYYNYKSKVTVYNAKMAQQNIKEDEIILNYIYSKNKGYVSVVDKNSVAIYKLKQIKNLATSLNTFRSLISSPFTNANDSNRFKTVSNAIFESLFPFDDNISFLKNKKLIVIPGESFQGIPFESLVTNTKQNINRTYLLNACDISYAYSYSSLIKLSNTDNNFDNNAYAISPVEFKKQNLQSLSISKEDSKRLENLLSTTLIEKQDASKANFIDAYGDYKIIHIATHGGVENNRAWLAFNDDKLMFDEIYFKEKKAELVILSACKTSQGELKKGEGIMSIARGFTNAGAQSIVSSLWDLNQKSSNEIIFEFYKNLNNNDSKSVALKKAKLAYLEKYKNTSEASPYYWSSIILTGNNNPIVFKNNTYLYSILAGLLIISLIIYFLIRKQKRKKID